MVGSRVKVARTLQEVGKERGECAQSHGTRRNMKKVCTLGRSDPSSPSLLCTIS